VLSQLTDNINEEVFQQNPNLKIVANYAVGFNNIDVQARGIRLRFAVTGFSHFPPGRDKAQGCRLKHP
jgi:lactate dehydrogenase-like 2-hydroxyacid dehydrogenase